MDGITLVLFLAAAFAGGLVSGVSGFAMGLVVSGIWLHIITPGQNALLIVLCGLVTQGSGIWRVRHAIAWRAVLPFILGGAIGVAFGWAVTVPSRLVTATMATRSRVGQTGRRRGCMRDLVRVRVMGVVAGRAMIAALGGAERIDLKLG